MGGSAPKVEDLEKKDEQKPAEAPAQNEAPKEESSTTPTEPTPPPAA